MVFDGSDVVLFYFCFFFQAEDGIRDTSVTGVQTCALPISYEPELRLHGGEVRVHKRSFICFRRRKSTTSFTSCDFRSEERRVGKECRFRCWMDRDKKNQGDFLNPAVPDTYQSVFTQTFNVH